MGSTPDREKFKKEYDQLKPGADEVLGRLTGRLQALLKEKLPGVHFQVQGRVKTWESIAGKLGKLSFKKVRAIQDVIGLRVVCLFKPDMEKIAGLITDGFTVLKKDDKWEKIDEDRFGYLSIHFVIDAGEGEGEAAGLKAEIQVRTMPQHLWAEASHLLSYKKEEDVPMALKRPISRIAALLEIVDLEFERFIRDRDEYRAGLHRAPGEERLNVDLLERILDELLPAVNKMPGLEDYPELLEELKDGGITTKDGLVSLINAHRQEMLAKDGELARTSLEELTGEILKEAASLKAGIEAAPRGCAGEKEASQRKAICGILSQLAGTPAGGVDVENIYGQLSTAAGMAGEEWLKERLSGLLQVDGDSLKKLKMGAYLHHTYMVSLMLMRQLGME
jgi:ppGpp synthetase/RelA/SpoT-type nucleotidyltranferase